MPFKVWAANVPTLTVNSHVSTGSRTLVCFGDQNTAQYPNASILPWSYRLGVTSTTVVQLGVPAKFATTNAMTDWLTVASIADHCVFNLGFYDALFNAIAIPGHTTSDVVLAYSAVVALITQPPTGPQSRDYVIVGIPPPSGSNSFARADVTSLNNHLSLAFPGHYLAAPDTILDPDDYSNATGPFLNNSGHNKFAKAIRYFLLGL